MWMSSNSRKCKTWHAMQQTSTQPWYLLSLLSLSLFSSSVPSPQESGNAFQMDHAQRVTTVPLARPRPLLHLSHVLKVSIVLKALPSQGPVRMELSSLIRQKASVNCALKDSTVKPWAQVSSWEIGDSLKGHLRPLMSSPHSHFQLSVLLLKSLCTE